MATLSGGKKFTTLDLSAAYQQMRMLQSTPTVPLYTATFGVASAPTLFQKAMDAILNGILHVICYIDGVLLTGANDEEHLCNLAKLLRRLQEQGMRLKRDKCKFLKDSIDCLGYHIDAQGCHTSTRKVEAILKAPAPTFITELWSFLGLLNYIKGSPFLTLPQLFILSMPYSELEVNGDGVSSVQTLSSYPRRSSWRHQCLLTMTHSYLSNWRECTIGC